MFIQLVPVSLRSAIAWAWTNAGPEALLRQILGRENYNQIIAAFSGTSSGSRSGGGDDSTNALHITTWSHMRHLHAYFQDEAASFHQMRMTKSLVVNDLMTGMKVKGSPRPMSTIAVDPDSDINNLKCDVKAFFDDPNVFKKLTGNHRPYQKLFILHGPPGNGKSSILQALAIEYGISYYIMNIGSNKKITLRDIKHKLQPTLSGTCLVIFEDAESALPKSSSNELNHSISAVEDEDSEIQVPEPVDKPKFSVEEFLALFDGSVDSGKPNGRLVCK